MTKNPNNKTPKNAKKLICETCDFKCNKQSDYNRHLITHKHKILINPNIATPKTPIYYECECGKKYKHSSSLSAHKKKCILLQKDKEDLVKEEDLIKEEDIQYVSSSEINKDILLMLLKKQDFMEELVFKNQEFMNKMMEVMPQIGNITNNNNCHNKTFNINMFLNEHCKNAMNLTDFIESLPITDKTYDNTIKNGLTNTITTMMVDGLNELDILERPIHCTDTKRKTMYVKENDVWEKDKELIKTLTGIKKTALNNRMKLNKWQDVNDGWMVRENIQMKYLSLVSNVMTIIEDEDKEINKIINAIGKKVYLDEDTKKEYL